MTEEALNKLCDVGYAVKKETAKLKDPEEFISVICTTIDEWCEEKHKSKSKIAFAICRTIQEAKELKKKGEQKK